ncbi:CapA family protein [Ammoniphilus sp. 3BR4]|uniref:CapA family protein n=1 Tax=Ammoniphilus sp. 3BR4 TaxID=3158265 RepID=UPI003464F76C
MGKEIIISAVGDLLMKAKIIDSARVAGKNQYSFDSMFNKVSPFLKSADLTIGNLETTFSGRAAIYERRSPRTGFPLFNCPDELAPALRRAGFNILMTANNHCMDGGVEGLKRTLRVLDSNGLAHTGTFADFLQSRKFLIKNVKGIRIGFLAYTKGTNSIPIPAEKPWLVNLIGFAKMKEDLQRLRAQVDFIVVYLHFGKEYHQTPSEEQKQIVEWLFAHGANIVLGAHPHVLQPMVFTPKGKFVIYSLGNFISTMLRKNPFTLNGVIFYLRLRKDNKGQTSITGIHYIPTWVYQSMARGRSQFRILPIPQTLRNPHSNIPVEEQRMMRRMWAYNRRLFSLRSIK